MAGEWIPIDCNLGTKPEVLELVAETGDPADAVVGRLVTFWAWCQLNAVDGRVPGKPGTLAIAAGGTAEFWLAVERVGWIRFEDGNVHISGWEDRFSQAAKERQKDARRQSVRRKRDTNRTGVTPEQDTNRTRVRSEADENRTRVTPRPDENRTPTGLEEKREEERRREEKHTTHAGGDADFSPGWAATEWEAFVSAWNRTARAKPWTPLLAPDGWADLAASPGWLAKAREALARLPTCEFFRDPVAVTRFFAYVDRILAGEFDTAKQDTREQHHQRRRQPAGGNL